MWEAVISTLTQRTEGVAAGWTQAHGGVGLQHHSHATGSARAVHNVCHQVQAVLQQQAVIACKLILPNQQLHLSVRHYHVTIWHLNDVSNGLEESFKTSLQSYYSSLYTALYCILDDAGMTRNWSAPLDWFNCDAQFHNAIAIISLYASLSAWPTSFWKI